VKRAAPSASRDQTIAALISATLRAGHVVRFRALGSSMVPALWPGDVLVAKPLDGAPPAIGDITLTMSDRGLIVHRLVEQRLRDGETLIVTRGDALATCDPATPASAVVGVVVSRNGQPIRIAQTSRGFFGEALSRLGSSAGLGSTALRLRALAPRLRAAGERAQLRIRRMELA
jgi:hypothetical protein